MAKFLRAVEVVLITVGILLYISAKIHFFTRYGALSTGTYLEEHWPIWAGMVIVGLALALVGWLSERLNRKKPN